MCRMHENTLSTLPGIKSIEDCRAEDIENAFWLLMEEMAVEGLEALATHVGEEFLSQIGALYAIGPAPLEVSMQFLAALR